MTKMEDSFGNHQDLHMAQYILMNEYKYINLIRPN